MSAAKMKRPATIDGIALIASTSIRTGRASRPPTSLRNIAVPIAERHRDQRREPDLLERADDRVRRAAVGRRAQRADEPLVLGEEPVVSAW